MNYYEILKVSRQANAEEIKSSYKTLVKKYHPDLYVGNKNFAEKKIKEINEAYEILSNPKSKKEYDDYLNPPIEHQTYEAEYTYNPLYYTYNSKHNNQKQEKTEPWSITQLIINKINTLDSKQQLRIFIFILVFLLALLLINLLKMKNYLETGESPFINPNIIYDETQQDYSDDEDYYEDDFDLEEFWYNLFDDYTDNEEDFYDNYDEINIYTENSISL